MLHKVKIRYVFEGFYDIEADDGRDARRIAEQDCGMILGGGIHTSNGTAVHDWKFPVHPDIKIISCKKKGIIHY